MKHLFIILLFFNLLTSPFPPEVNAAVPALVDAGNGTIVDTANNLAWLKNANCFDLLNWSVAMDRSNNLESGQCGLNDLSKAGDWRLPTVQEMWSLSERGSNFKPFNAAGFINVQEDWYWATGPCFTSVHGGQACSSDFINYNTYLWPVRSGQFWSFDSLVLSALLNYDSPLVGSPPIVREVTITNSNLIGLEFISISITGADATFFTVDQGGRKPCASLTPTLSGGQACTVQVTCNSTLGGLKNAYLTVATTNITGDVPITANVLATIYGNISDQSTGKPVTEATVSLMPGGTIATSKSDGTYTFDNLPSAIYSISVAKSSYQTTSKSGLVVTSTSSAKADILLPTVGTLNIVTTSLPWASPNVPYSKRVMLAGGTAPYTFSMPYGTLPTGLTMDTSTGDISGTPTGTEAYTFAIGVTDNVLGYSEKDFTIELLPPLEITPTALPSGQAGVVYSSSILAIGGKPGYTFTLSGGTLPNGLTLDSSGGLSGMPKESGTFSISVRLSVVS